MISVRGTYDGKTFAAVEPVPPISILANNGNCDVIITFVESGIPSNDGTVKFGEVRKPSISDENWKKCIELLEASMDEEVPDFPRVNLFGGRELEL
ncbi:MAG: hypothetical protein LBU65_04600 [Planctomycetaceae bacterium]|jgi:hypothetical protein|nr:hypothetical protein [Planctomycetaceae bacterium]